MGNIAIITARSGSKGLRDKNIRKLCGKPLLAYSVECALQSGCFDRVFVSTDSLEYAAIAEKFGADASFLRSEETSGDTAGSWDVVREVIYKFEERGEYFDRIMLLQPTSPLRTVSDIRNSFALMEEKGANSIVSVCEMEHSPLWSNTLGEDLCMDNFRRENYCDVRRQDLPKYYRLNGAVYLVNRAELDQPQMLRHKSYAYIMPAERSVDVDTEFDFKIAECYMAEGVRSFGMEENGTGNQRGFG